MAPSTAQALRTQEVKHRRMPRRALSPCSGPQGGEWTRLIAAVGVCDFAAARANLRCRPWGVEVACQLRVHGFDCMMWWARTLRAGGSRR